MLLVTGVGQGRRKGRALEDAEAALAGWVGLPPQILIPDAPADVVQLPAGSGPQTVRGYLERASVTRGPVLVYLTGHLMPDRRGELHVTLRDSTPGSVRYDGLPWAWLAETMRIRDPLQTLVIADLTASDALRTDITAASEVLTDRLPLWAVLTPPASHDRPAHAFTRTLTVAARRGFAGCPPLLDAATVHPAIFGRAQLADGTVQIVPAPGTTLRLVNRIPVEEAAQNAVALPAAHTPRHARPATAATEIPRPLSPIHRDELSGGRFGPEERYPTEKFPQAVPGAHVSPGTDVVPVPRPIAETPAGASTATSHLRVAFPPPAAREPGTPEPTSPAALTPVAAPTPPTPQHPQQPGQVPKPGTGHGAIPSTGVYLYRERVTELRAAVSDGHFDAALLLARGIAQDMETRYGLGPEHRDTLDALETWAWLAAQAGHTAEAVTLYTEAARRSARIHGPGHETTRAAADAAHTMWLRITDVQRARDLGPTVVALRELVLGTGPHTREAAAAHLAALSAPGPADDEPIPPPPELRDALADVAAIAATGRNAEAVGAADAVVAALAADLGSEHPHTLNVREVRAYLTAESGRLPEAVAAYLDIAEARLADRGPEHPDTAAALDNAHALWLRLADADHAAVATGHRLVALRRHLPGPGGRALADAATRLDTLFTAKPSRPRVAAVPSPPTPEPTRGIMVELRPAPPRAKHP
ncbi:MAG: hypothetical protein HOV68_23895, partial [Streptomycetaceae bacterium]|nr:hypothetical protein [Streptomycetaceae bacterium]